MQPRHLRSFAAMLLLASPVPAALACGDGEAPVSCDDPSPNGFASWMLGRVERALQRDRGRALAEFSAGAQGFRTADTYVFCLDPGGVMDAHPDAALRGRNVGDLHDRTGHYFIRTMLREARPGQISVIRYRFPKPGGTAEEPKTTYYTRTGDEICAVGTYDADAAPRGPLDPEARLAQLRRKLDAEMPAAVRADWTEFLDALNRARDARRAAMSAARREIGAAVAALDAQDDHGDAPHD